MNSEVTKGRRFGLDLPDGFSVYVPAEVEALATASVDAALAAHCELGPGLLVSAYEACMEHELELRGIRIQRQFPVSLDCCGVRIEVGCRTDLLLDTRLLLELKAVQTVLPFHRAQGITYLKLLKLPLCLLINFNSLLLKDGLVRVLKVPLRHA